MSLYVLEPEMDICSFRHRSSFGSKLTSQNGTTGLDNYRSHPLPALSHSSTGDGRLGRVMYIRAPRQGGA
jgi:hypothetical protein